MSQLQRAVQRELDDFINNIQKDSLSRVSKAAFSKARAKLKHTAFIHLGDIVIKKFYTSSPFKKDWKGFRLIACDGSTCEVPNSEENVKKFGVQHIRSDGKIISLARICELYDPLNNLILSAQISPYKISEPEMLKSMLTEKKYGQGDLFIFDRNYYSTLLVLYFNHIKADFCFRVKKDIKAVKDIEKSQLTDKIIEVRLNREHKQEASLLGISSEVVKCRIVKIQLKGGESEYLITSLVNKEITIEELKELYGSRWGIEENYKKLKHQICIENFSGKSVESVYQDFYAKIFILNLTASLIHPIDKVLSENPKVKHIHKVNFISALGKMKYVPIGLFIKRKTEQTIGILHQWLIRTTEPIRKERKFKRTKLSKRKYHQNYKPA